MNSSNICDKLVKARGERKQREVAKAIGISDSALAMYEGGNRVPRDEIKEKLAKFYGLSVGFLFFDENVHS